MKVFLKFYNYSGAKAEKTRFVLPKRRLLRGCRVKTNKKYLKLMKQLFVEISNAHVCPSSGYIGVWRLHREEKFI